MKVASIVNDKNELFAVIEESAFQELNIMNKTTIVAVFLVLLTGNFCFANPVNATPSATIDYKNITSPETPDRVPSYLGNEPEPPQKLDKILNFHVGSLQDNEDIIESPPSWATNLENDFSFSVQIKIPFL